jgi:hypothetical protein
MQTQLPSSPASGLSAHVLSPAISAGVLIAAPGAMLMLSFALPFSDSLPVWSVLLLSTAASGRDGLCFFAGCTRFPISFPLPALAAVDGADASELGRGILRD